MAKGNDKKKEEMTIIQSRTQSMRNYRSYLQERQDGWDAGSEMYQYFEGMILAVEECILIAEGKKGY